MQEESLQFSDKLNERLANQQLATQLKALIDTNAEAPMGADEFRFLQKSAQDQINFSYGSKEQAEIARNFQGVTF